MLLITHVGDSRKLYPSLWLLACHAVLCVIGGFCLALTATTGQPIRRATDTSSTSVQNMGIDHCRANVLVSQEFLHGADVVAVGEQMGGE